MTAVNAGRPGRFRKREASPGGLSPGLPGGSDVLSSDVLRCYNPSLISNTFVSGSGNHRHRPEWMELLCSAPRSPRVDEGGSGWAVPKANSMDATCMKLRVLSRSDRFASSSGSRGETRGILFGVLGVRKRRNHNFRTGRSVAQRKKLLRLPKLGMETLHHFNSKWATVCVIWRVPLATVPSHGTFAGGFRSRSASPTSHVARFARFVEAVAIVGWRP